MCEHVISWENRGRNPPIDGSTVKQKDVEGQQATVDVCVFFFLLCSVGSLLRGNLSRYFRYRERKVCVCVWEREIERKVSVCVWEREIERKVSVCVWERERDGKKGECVCGNAKERYDRKVCVIDKKREKKKCRGSP